MIIYYKIFNLKFMIILINLLIYFNFKKQSYKVLHFLKYFLQKNLTIIMDSVLMLIQV